MDNIKTAYLAGMRSLLSVNRRVQYLVYVTDISSKYARVKPSKDKKAKTVLHCLIEILKESKRQPNKLIVSRSFI